MSKQTLFLCFDCVFNFLASLADTFWYVIFPGYTIPFSHLCQT